MRSPYPAGLVIATKGGFERPGPDQWVENGRPEHLKSACEESLRRLRLDRIDVYQLHRIDPRVPAEDQLGTLKDLQAQGKIRHIGLSEVSVGQIQHAQAIVPIVSVQNHYSLADRGSEDVLKYCEQRTIGGKGLAKAICFSNFPHKSPRRRHRVSQSRVGEGS
jgi:pyridoxine 4-dehydrogenase